MRYYKVFDDNYIHVIGTGAGGEEIIETQYNEMLSMIHNRPAAPEGFAYRLTKALEWELQELPPVEEAEATEEDYISALAELGVNVHEEK